MRFLLLSTHYRSPIEYSDERLAEVKRSLEGFYRFFERYQRITGQTFFALSAAAKRQAFEGKSEFLGEVAKHRDRFLELMDDDFNTGGAVGTIYELLTTLNRFADARKLEDGKPDPAVVAEFQKGVSVLRELSQLLGLFADPPAKTAGDDDDKLVGGLMQLLIDLRAEARKSKNFAMADQIRKRLTDLGVTLEDRPGKTEWRVGS